MKAALLVVAALVAGCGKVRFDSAEATPFGWQAATQLCSNQGGVERVWFRSWGYADGKGGVTPDTLTVSVLCQNGVTASRSFDFKEKK